MPTLTFDPTGDAPSSDQLQAEAAALAQGEILAEAAAEDRARKLAQTDSENAEVQLIGGKFKSQEDLLKAYEELQKKLGKGEVDEDDSDSSEEPTEGSDDESEEVDTAANQILSRAADEYAKGGKLSEEAIDELAKLDSKELIKAYVDFYSKNAAQYQQNAALQQAEAAEVMNIAGGEQGYTEMVQWAAENLDQQEIDAFNSVTTSGNVAAIKFAVEALHTRYRSAEGYEAPLVSGKRSNSGGPKPYRSHAELARDISDPRYSNDPAFRADVEERLARSKDLL